MTIQKKHYLGVRWPVSLRCDLSSKYSLAMASRNWRFENIFSIQVDNGSLSHLPRWALWDYILSFSQFTSPRPRFPPHPSTYCTPRPPFGTWSPCRFDTFSYNRVWASFMLYHYVSLFDLGMRILTSSSERPRSSGSPKSKGPPDAFGWTSGWARLLLKLAYSYFSSKILQSGEDIWLPITRVESETIQCCSVAQLMLYSSFQMYFNTIY